MELEALRDELPWARPSECVVQVSVDPCMDGEKR